MKIRLGYAAIALGLPKVTSSSNVTYTFYNKIPSEDKRLIKLKQVTYSNVSDLKKILQYNIDNTIHFYRMTSALVPLATHPDVNWDYRSIFSIEFKTIGEIIKKSKMRIDTHPDQFNVINSVNQKVVENTKNNLFFHVGLFKDMEYDDGKMVLHIGSGAGGKEDALNRFENNFYNYPEEITSKIILENDDKTFTAKDTLRLCNKLGVPMVLDAHHHMCNNNGENLDEMLADICNTWNDEKLPPKMHFSSPKNGAADRKHADYINTKEFINFIENCRRINRDIDIMIEAKKKDLALLELIRSIKELRNDIKWSDSTTMEL